MSEFDVAVAISRAIGDAGGRALIVGGWVRDRMLGPGRRTWTSSITAYRPIGSRQSSTHSAR